MKNLNEHNYTFDDIVNNDSIDDTIDIEFDNLTNDQVNYLLDSGYVKCDDCDELISENEQYAVLDEYGNVLYRVCEDCIDNYSYCEDSGEYYIDDAMEVIDYGTRNEAFVARCSNAFEMATRCDECDRYYSDVYMHNGSNRCICSECWDTGEWCWCDDCGDIISYDDAFITDDGTYCPYCATDHQAQNIEEYHHDNQQNKLTFHSMPDEETDLYMGVELEVEADNYSVDLDRVAGEVKEICEDLIVKGDGSLDNGFEMVSQPCTLNYHLSRMPWKGITQTCIDNGMLSDMASNCGLHVHVSRQGLGNTEEQQDLTIAKLLVLFDRFEAQIEQFARRKSDRWAAFYKTEGKDIEKDMYYTLMNKAGGYDMARYHAINLVNIHTIEFRVFKGSLNIETIKATIQFVHTIVNFAIKADLLTVQNCEWSDIFKGVEYDELKAYLNRRHLD